MDTGKNFTHPVFADPAKLQVQICGCKLPLVVYRLMGAESGRNVLVIFGEVSTMSKSASAIKLIQSSAKSR